MLLGSQMLKFNKGKPPEYWGLTFTAEEPNVVVNMAKAGSPPSVTLEYSTNGKKWLAFDPDGATPVTLKKAGSKVFFRAGSGGNTAFASSDANYRKFTFSKRCSASGSIMSILDADDDGLSSISSPYAFCRLFMSETKLVSPPVLPATSIAGHCYTSMFEGCSSLASQPELPATSLESYCYSRMFYNCSSLSSSAAIRATSTADYCCYMMFYGCSMLASPPSIQATSLAEYCYRAMFYGCSRLASAPALPAETLATGCYYQMFNGCTSLISAPALPAASMASMCYAYMLSECTRISTAPLLPSTLLAGGCYQSMFSGCTGLAAAPQLPATELADQCYMGMFSGCTKLTSGPQLPATTMKYRCYRGMFDGCTRLTNPPALPSMNLYEQCYAEMFRGCSSLVNAPQLPATTMTYECYWRMFQNCTSLVVALDLPCEYIINSGASNSYSDMFRGCSRLSSIKISARALSGNFNRWVEGVASSGTFKCQKICGTNATISRGVGACPTGWTVENFTQTEPLTFTSGESSVSISMPKNGSPSVTVRLKSSVDNGETWQDFTPGTTTITLANAGAYCLML